MIEPLPTPRRSNCLIWALYMQYLFGGKVCIRWSENWFGPHWYWAGEDEAWGYSPINVLKPIPWNILWFRGKIKREGRNKNF